MLDNLIRYNLFSISPIPKTSVSVTGFSYPTKNKGTQNRYLFLLPVTQRKTDLGKIQCKKKFQRSYKPTVKKLTKKIREADQ
jgi:hypothetical protein